MYQVRLRPSVRALVARLVGDDLLYWNAFVDEVSADPQPRFDQWIEHSVPLRGFRVRAHNYEIHKEISISGEPFYVFVAEFLPFFCPLYAIDDIAREVDVFYLRDNRYF